MKSVLILASILFTATICNAQYSKDKLTDVLTGGSAKAWTVKGATTSYNFNKDNTVTVGGKTEKWELSSEDNIRWFLTIGNTKQEIIVSYDKAGTQFVKLTNMNRNTSLYTEQLLYPAK